MLILTIAMAAALIGGVVIGDHVLEIERPKMHMAFLYAAVISLVFAVSTAQTTGALS